MAHVLSYVTFSLLALLTIGFFVLVLAWRVILKQIVKKVAHIVLTDSYQENLLELLPGFKHLGLQNALENSLRAESGDVLNRPLGSTKSWPHFAPLTFIPAQTTPFATSSFDEVDLRVTIGPKAKKPLKMEMPLMISGMAYGIALSKEVRLALTEAARKKGIALNSGEGGILQEELAAAGKYILQFSKNEWGKKQQFIERADMIEIKLGQGAKLGIGAKISPDNLTGEARETMGLKDGEDAVIYEHFFSNQTLRDIKKLVHELRELSNGVPIGVKIGAGGKIETDIDHLLKLGVDYIAIDGGQASTHASAPILADDFGIPTLHALVRAVNHLEKRKMKKDVSLIISGGLFVPGDFLKVLALGADAVYLGTAILFAVAHDQGTKALPFEPPTQVVWNEGKFSNQFDVAKGAASAEKFLNASAEEMKMALRAMGKRSLRELSKADLVSYDELTAKMVGVPYTFRAWDEETLSNK